MQKHIRITAILSAAATITFGACAEPRTAPETSGPGAPTVRYLDFGTGPKAVPLDSEVQWVSGMHAVYLGPGTGRACFLTYINGRLNGASDWVGVVLDFAGWKLTGASTGSGLSGIAGRARCYAASVVSSEAILSRVPGPETPDSSVTLGGGACGITRVGGKFARSDDLVQLYPNNVDATSWTLWFFSPGLTDKIVGARCIRSPATVLDISGGWTGEAGAVHLGHKGDFCTISFINGAFRQIGNDWVWLNRGSTGWYLWGGKSTLGVNGDCFHTT